jgi:hypothetical protein
MLTNYPLAASGERQPKRARPLSAGVRTAVKALVWGVEGYDYRRPVTLGEAAAEGAMRPDTLRRYLHRLDVRALIADEKKAFLAWANSANAQALMDIRDTSANDAARVRAVLALEELEGPRDGPGVSVTVNNAVAVGAFKPGYVIRLRNYDKPAPALPEREAQPAGDGERR